MGRGRERKEVDRQEVERSLSSCVKYEDWLRVEDEVIYGLMHPAVSEKHLNIVSGGLSLYTDALKYYVTGFRCNFNSFKNISWLNVYVCVFFPPPILIQLLRLLRLQEA